MCADPCPLLHFSGRGVGGAHPPESRDLRSFLSREMWPVFYLWGYPLTAIAVALMIGTLITYERDRRDGQVRPWAPICALLCAWLQPWQGSTLLLIVLATEALLWWRKQRASLVLPAITAAGAVLPLGYYSLLGRFDASWALSGRVDFSQDLPLEDLLAVVLPLGVCAAFAYLGHPKTFEALAVRIWPFGAFAVLEIYPTHSYRNVSKAFAPRPEHPAGRSGRPWHAANRSHPRCRQQGDPRFDPCCRAHRVSRRARTGRRALPCPPDCLRF